MLWCIMIYGVIGFVHISIIPKKQPTSKFLLGGRLSFFFGLFSQPLLGLPIPFMFFSDTDDGRCEIIDGAQRTCTLEEFMSGDLVLSDLKKLTVLNGFSYADLPEYFIAIQQKSSGLDISGKM